MTKFKKCDDCETILTRENKNKFKIGRGLGVPRHYKDKDGGITDTHVEIFWFCTDCFKYHDHDEEDPELAKLLKKKRRNKEQAYIEDTSELVKKINEWKK